MILRYGYGKRKTRLFKNIDKIICEDINRFEEYLENLRLLLDEYNGKMIFGDDYLPDFIEIPDDDPRALMDFFARYG